MNRKNANLNIVSIKSGEAQFWNKLMRVPHLGAARNNRQAQLIKIMAAYTPGKLPLA